LDWKSLSTNSSIPSGCLAKIRSMRQESKSCIDWVCMQSSGS
jgi:hypothetical protein